MFARHDGFAALVCNLQGFDDEALRVSQLSAPIFDASGAVVASLLVLGSSELMTAADMDSLGAALIESTAAVARAICGVSAHHS